MNFDEESGVMGEVEPLVTTPQEINRITALFTLHHQQTGEQPRSVQLVVQRLLKVTAESYSRRLRATEQWSRVDQGSWINADDAGCIIVENLEGKNLSTHPSPEERAALERRELQIAFEGCPEYAFFPVAPGDFVSLPVKSTEHLRIRCKESGAWFRVYVFPR